jgi:hypothetical protein
MCTDNPVGQNKDDLLEMIQHGAEKIINNSNRSANIPLPTRRS